jgi:hypothetical protein
MGGQGRRCKQRLDDIQKKRRYWNLREEALGHPLLRTYFKKGTRSCPMRRDEFRTCHKTNYAMN